MLDSISGKKVMFGDFELPCDAEASVSLFGLYSARHFGHSDSWLCGSSSEMAKLNGVNLHAWLKVIVD